MTPDPSPTLYGQTDYRGWTLQATWFRSSLGVPEGWVCFATRPRASHKLNIGRWGSVDLALAGGRAYVDRQIDNVTIRANLPIQERRQ